MGRKPKSPDQIRGKLNLTIRPEIREWADALKRRRSISQLFEDLVEAEWNRQYAAMQNPPQSLQPVGPFYNPVRSPLAWAIAAPNSVLTIPSIEILGKLDANFSVGFPLDFTGRMISYPKTTRPQFLTQAVANSGHLRIPNSH
jgi:hypothetical protein